MKIVVAFGVVVLATLAFCQPLVATVQRNLHPLPLVKKPPQPPVSKPTHQLFQPDPEVLELEIVPPQMPDIFVNNLGENLKTKIPQPPVFKPTPQFFQPDQEVLELEYVQPQPPVLKPTRQLLENFQPQIPDIFISNIGENLKPKIPQPPVVKPTPQFFQPDQEVVKLENVQPQIPDILVNKVSENNKPKPPQPPVNNIRENPKPKPKPQVQYFNGKVVPTPKHYMK